MFPKMHGIFGHMGNIFVLFSSPPDIEAIYAGEISHVSLCNAFTLTHENLNFKVNFEIFVILI